MKDLGPMIDARLKTYKPGNLMAKSTNDQSQTSVRKTSQALHNVTFSQALEDGLTHSGWLIGQKMESI